MVAVVDEAVEERLSADTKLVHWDWLDPRFQNVRNQEHVHYRRNPWDESDVGMMRRRACLGHIFLMGEVDYRLAIRLDRRFAKAVVAMMDAENPRYRSRLARLGLRCRLPGMGSEYRKLKLWWDYQNAAGPIDPLLLVWAYTWAIGDLEKRDIVALEWMRLRDERKAKQIQDEKADDAGMADRKWDGGCTTPIGATSTGAIPTEAIPIASMLEEADAYALRLTEQAVLERLPWGKHQAGEWVWGSRWLEEVLFLLLYKTAWDAWGCGLTGQDKLGR